MYKEIRELRLKRRKAKDENDLIEEFYNFLNNNRDFKNKLQQIQGNSKKKYNAQQIRVYVPRQRNDLTITKQPCKAVKPFEELMKDFKSASKIGMVGGKVRNLA